MRSTDEIWEAVEMLTNLELVRLKLFAVVSMAAVGARAHGRDENDLLSEAIVATAAGELPWQDGTPLVAHLLGAMKAIAAGWSESEDLFFIDSYLNGASSDDVPAAIDPELVLQAKELLDGIRTLAAEDAWESEIVNFLALGYSGDEIQEKTGISGDDYRQAMGRLRRKLWGILIEPVDAEFEESLSLILSQALTIATSVERGS